MIVTTGQTQCGILGSIPGGDPFIYMGIGTGTTAESLAQTALVTPYGARLECVAIEEASKNVPGDTVRFLCIFPITTAQTITEVIVANALTAGTILNRKLLSPAVDCPANSNFVGVVEVTASDGGAI